MCHPPFPSPLLTLPSSPFSSPLPPPLLLTLPSPPFLLPLLLTPRDVLFTHFESVEEGTRNVVAECVGKLTLVDPNTLLSKLQASPLVSPFHFHFLISSLISSHLYISDIHTLQYFLYTCKLVNCKFKRLSVYVCRRTSSLRQLTCGEPWLRH